VRQECRSPLANRSNGPIYRHGTKGCDEKNAGHRIVFGQVRESGPNIFGERKRWLPIGDGSVSIRWNGHHLKAGTFF
jgi:hypothetical protein